MILKIFPTGPAQTNSILLGCLQTKECAIIDVPFESTPFLLREIEKHSLNVKMILLTHSHWDHIAEVALLKKKLEVPVLIHSEDAGNLEKPGSDGLPCFIPIIGVRADGFLKDDQVFSIGTLSIRVIHTPGHTPGGVCFYLAAQKVLIAGDTLFCGTIGNLSFPTSRPALMWKSLKRLSKLPLDTHVYPGHGEETTIGAEQWIAHAEEKLKNA
jgi:hydroxyacylglutathione hydrolase